MTTEELPGRSRELLQLAIQDIVDFGFKDSPCFAYRTKTDVDRATAMVAAILRGFLLLPPRLQELIARLGCLGAGQEKANRVYQERGLDPLSTEEQQETLAEVAEAFISQAILEEAAERIQPDPLEDLLRTLISVVS